MMSKREVAYLFLAGFAIAAAGHFLALLNKGCLP